MARVSVIGAGSWGTALAVLLNSNKHEVTLWSYSATEVDTLRKEREQKGKLPGVHIPEEIYITNIIEEAVKGQDVVVLAVPSTAIRSTATKCAPFVKEGQIFVDVAK